MSLKKQYFVGMMSLLQAILVLCAWAADGSYLPATHPYPIRYNDKAMPPPNIPADNPMTQEGVWLGRLLFYDPILSGNNKQSCGSCHIQKYNFTDNRIRAIGSRGDTLATNTQPLINLAWHNYYFWDGRTPTLEALIFEPILNPKEMGEKEANLLKELNKHPHYPELFEKAFGTKHISRPLLEKSIAQFLRTITSEGIHLPENVLNNPPKGMTEIEYYYQNIRDTSMRGLYFRFANMCGSCHRSEIYNDIDFKATNLVAHPDSLFKVPTLLNIALTAPYMHDGRMASIEDVFEHYDKHIRQLHQYNNPRIKQPIINRIINEYDKKHITQFLAYFSDSNLLINPEWSNPFEQPCFNWKTPNFN